MAISLPAAVSSPHEVERFGATVDPASYIPRPATVRALSALRAAALDGTRPVLLRGPGGIGKTLLLRLLALQVDPQLRPIYVPVSTLEQSELCALVLGLAGETAGAHPEPELLDFCGGERARGRPVLVLIDDAGSMCPVVARGLAGLAACSHRALRIVLAATVDERSEGILAALGTDTLEIPLRESMSPAETERYLRGRLSGTGESDAIDRERVACLHAESGGIPAELHVAWRRGGLESA